jgi:hypothetical protein
LESLEIVRARDAARTDWSPNRGIAAEDLVKRGRAYLKSLGY